MYRCCGLCCRMLSGQCILYWSARALMRVFRDALRCRTLVPFLVVVFGMGRRCIAHTGRTRLKVYCDAEATFDCCLPCLTHSSIPWASEGAGACFRRRCRGFVTLNLEREDVEPSIFVASFGLIRLMELDCALIGFLLLWSKC